MARHKNIEWSVPELTRNANGSRTLASDSIQISLLLDIRDELKQLNRVFACHRFTGFPNTLDRIARNTAKPRQKKGAA